MPTVINEGRRTAEFLASEAPGYLSREQITLLTGQNLKAGSVLGEITTGGTVTVSEATFSGTGNGALTLADPAYSSAVQEGDYLVTCVDPATDGGLFQVVRPDGTVDGTATVGTAYDGEVKFTIADSSTDFAAGDAFTIAVAVADPTNIGKYKLWNPANTDGSETAKAILYANVDASDADHDATIIARQAEVNGLVLEYFTGATDNNKALAKTQLADKTIIVR